MAATVETRVKKTLDYMNSPRGIENWFANIRHGYDFRKNLVAAIQTATRLIVYERISEVYEAMVYEAIQKNGKDAGMNQIQTAYIEAKTRYRMADNQRIEAEQAFIKARGIKNRDGSVPNRLEGLDLEDDPEAEKACRYIEEFWAMAPNPALEELLNQTRNVQMAAEDALITWGLSQMPAEEAGILRPRIEKIAVDRMKALELFMQLGLGAVQ